MIQPDSNPTGSNPALLLDELASLPADQRARWLSAGGKARQAVAGLVEYAAGLTASETGRAVSVTELIVDVADQCGSHLDRAKARRAQARALSYAGRYEDALAATREGVRLAEEAGLAIEAGRARLASMHALGELGRLDEAIRAGEAAREAFLTAGEPALAARADINLGGAHHRGDEPALAVECFDRARPLLAAEPLMLGHLENNRGEALVALNDFSGAQAAFTAALGAFTAAGATLTAAIAQGNLADLAARQGRLHMALEHFERARRQMEADHAATHLARLAAEQAEAMSVLGMPAEALAEYESALTELDRGGLALEAARARHGMGLTLMRLGRPAQAETALAAAATAFGELNHATARARIDLLRAELAAANGRAGEARAMALRSLGTLLERPADAIAARHLLARLAIEGSRWEEAAAALDEAAEAARRLDLAPLLADVLATRGRMHFRRGRPNEAAADLGTAIEQVERVRGSLQAERFRSAFSGQRTSLYESLVLALLDSNAEDAMARAFAAAEQAKSRSLLERIHHAAGGDDRRRAPASPASPVPPVPHDEAEAALLEEEDRLRSELNALYSRIGDDPRRHAGEAGSASWRAAVRQRETQLDAVERRLASTAGVGRLHARTITLDQARRNLPAGEALIEYFIAEGELMAFIITAEGARVCRNLARSTDVTTMVERIGFQMNRALRPGAMEGPRCGRLADDARRELGRAHDMLMAPMSQALAGIGRLTIVPHGPLHLLPFHALWDGSRYLVQRCEIQIAPSASLGHELREAAASTADWAALAADAVVVGAADEQAPHIAAEARQVARILGCDPARVLVNERATAARATELMRSAPLIHLACHGRFDADSRFGSGLKLADQWLTMRDILGLRLQARLVTLSGCETGVNLVKAGDELMGLLRGFLAAGASALLVSLWPVADQATMDFMSAFYSLLNTAGSQGRISGVLRAAQLQMLERHGHPAFWAPFFLVGREQ